MALMEIGWQAVDYILAQRRGQWWTLVNTVIKLRVS